MSRYSPKFKLFLGIGLVGFVLGTVCQVAMLQIGWNIYLATIQRIAALSAILAIVAFLVTEWRAK